MMKGHPTIYLKSNQTQLLKEPDSLYFFSAWLQWAGSNPTMPGQKVMWVPPWTGISFCLSQRPKVKAQQGPSQQKGDSQLLAACTASEGKCFLRRIVHSRQCVFNQS